MSRIRDDGAKLGASGAGGGPDAEVSAPGLAGLQSVLTERELEVSLLVAKGLTNEQIGCVLGVSMNAIKATLARAFRRLDIESRVELVAILFDRL
jgi:DNA-binding CsgD family transcriptional regulator